MANPEKAVNIDDLRELARRRMLRLVFDSIEIPAGNGAANRRNVDRLDDILFIPRLLREVSPADTTATLFGQTYASPFGVSAFGSAGMFWPHGDEEAARAAHEAGVPYILSGAAHAGIETIARIHPRAWYQVYAARDADLTERMVKRARDAGVETLVYTIDFPVFPRSAHLARAGVNLNDAFSLTMVRKLFLDGLMHPAWTLAFLRHGRRNRLESWVGLPGAGEDAGQVRALYGRNAYHSHLPRDIEAVRRMWPGNLVIKGVTHPDDAAQVVELGADAVTVSNHGGTKIDNMPATIDSLGPVVAAVGGRVPVFFDGGIRRGSHVLAALCLGASYCFGGRVAIFGLGAAGGKGVARGLQIMHAEIESTLGMLGCRSLDQLGPEFLASP